MLSTTKKGFIIIFFLLLSSPIFIYYNKSDISLNNCITPCVAIQPITFILLLFTFFLIIKNKLILLSVFFLFIFNFFTYISSDLFYLIIKSLVPFFFLAGFILIKKEFENYLNFVKFLINIFLPYCIIFFQIIIFFCEIFNFLLRSANINEPLENVFFLNIQIYNYWQYFSFILALVCGIRLFLISKKKEEFFLASLMILSSYHSNNYNALICSILIIFFKVFFFISKKNEKNLRIFKLISYLFAVAIFLIPIFNFSLVKLTEDYVNINNLQNLYFRYYMHAAVLNNLNFEHLIFGLYPDLITKQQPHSQFLEYVLYHGFLRATFLIFIIFFMMSKINRIEYLLPLCIIIGLGGALNELFSHWYNSQIIFFYIIFSSLIKEKKN